MKPIAKKSSRRAAFTIIELLTVMSIIILIIGMLVPALNRIRRYARRVSQKNQFHALEVGLDLFSAEREEYPPSEYLNPPGDYCGANKLAEAMVGQDLHGFHPNSRFTADDGIGSAELYPAPLAMGDPGWDLYQDNLQRRKGPYLSPQTANAYSLADIYSKPGRFLPTSLVLCDVYANVTNIETGGLMGMPLLYYRADTAKMEHSFETLPYNIYNYLDNHALAELGVGREPSGQQELYRNPAIFYKRTQNDQLTRTAGKPMASRADSYILLSAGHDGEYGTPDDVFNFGN
ncbi:MAG: type II secretion system protein [Planctomycetota bacterium]